MAEAAAETVGLAAGKPYIPVFVALGVLTLIEVQIPALDIAWAAQFTALMIFATGKAALVVLYYMHVRYEPRFLSLVALIPLFMALGLVLTLIAG